MVVEYGLNTNYGERDFTTGDRQRIVAREFLGGVEQPPARHGVSLPRGGSNGVGTTQGSDASFTTLFTPPTATTGAATPGTTFATLNGMVNPNGVTTSVRFEYGTTAGLGDVVNLPGTLSGTTTQPVAITVSGLTAQTQHHYRVTATSSAGTTPRKHAGVHHARRAATDRDAGHDVRQHADGAAQCGRQ